MAKEKVCGIYCIENLINHKKYVGQSIDIHARWKQHRSLLERGIHSNEKLQNAWNKYGADNFVFYVVQENDVLELDYWEKYYISLYDSYKHGYNKDLGGVYNRIISDETRQKMSQRMQNLTDDEREKYRLGQPSRPIYQIDMNGEIVKEWYGAREASKKLNFNQSAIFECLHHTRWTYRGYIWLFVDEIDSFVLGEYKNRRTQSRKVAQKTLDGTLVKIWDSATKTREAGFDPSSVVKCCKEKIKYHKNFYWSYV